MIDQFKETDVRHSGVIFEGTFEQIKKFGAKRRGRTAYFVSF